MAADVDVLRISTLRTVLDRILEDVEREFGPEIPLSKDYYWTTPIGAAFDVHLEPGQLTIGQVTDDVAEMTAMADGDQPDAIWHRVAHAIGALRFLEHLSAGGS